MNLSRRRRQLILFAVDMAWLYAALFLALTVRGGQTPSFDSWREHAYAFSFAFIAWAVVFYTAGLYVLEAPFDGARFAAKLFVAVAISALLTALMFYLNPSTPISPKTVLFLFSAFAFGSVWAWRNIYGRLARAAPVRNAVAFIGVTDEVERLYEYLSERPYLGYSFALAYDERERDSQICPILASPEGLAEAVERQLPDLFVMAAADMQSVEARRVLFSQVGRGARFVSLSDFYESVLRRVPIDAISEAWFLQHIDLRAKKPYLALKRAVDLAAAAVGALVSLPLWPLIVAAIKLESPGPVIFSQVRLGRGGKPFTIYKFRTMRQEGNSYAPTAVGDARVTQIGKFLRATRLDEIPQLINIIKGDMSLVGPRPERPELARELAKEIPFYMERHLLKPGITGWDQVSGEYHSPSVADTYKKLQFDLYYVKNVSPFLDVSIFFKTILTVLARTGL